MDDEFYTEAVAHCHLSKTAGDAEHTFALRGELYFSKSGWLLLSVPNSVVRGLFDALHEPGAELPLQSSGNLNAHITVMRPEEIEQIGGADSISERGHHFNYSIGRIKTVEPKTWDGISRVWFSVVHSPELQALRRSYGLSGLPKDGKHEFHITIARRKTNVLKTNPVSKVASDTFSPAGLEAAAMLWPHIKNAIEEPNVPITIKDSTRDDKLPEEDRSNPESVLCAEDEEYDPTPADSTLDEHMDKVSSILSPILSAGSIAASVADMHQLRRNRQQPPEDMIREDNSYIDNIGGVKRKKNKQDTHVEDLAPEVEKKIASYYARQHTPSIHRPTVI